MSYWPRWTSRGWPPAPAKPHGLHPGQIWTDPGKAELILTPQEGVDVDRLTLGGSYPAEEGHR